MIHFARWNNKDFFKKTALFAATHWTSFALVGLVICGTLQSKSSQAELNEPNPPTVNPASFAGDSTYLGEFTVSRATETLKNGQLDDLCAPKDPDKEKDFRCDQKVWAYQKSDNLILVRAPNEDEVLSKLLFSFNVEGLNCDESEKFSAIEKKNGIFNTSMCRSPSPKSTASGGTIGFTKTDATIGILTSGIFVPGSIATQAEMSDNIITVTQHRESFFLGVKKIVTDRTFTLEPSIK